MEADDIGARLGKVGNDAVDRLDHQMHIDGHLHVRTDGFAHQRTDCQIGNIMIVHHIEMDDVGAGGHDIAHFFSQTREVGRKDAGCDAICGHEGFP